MRVSPQAKHEADDSGKAESGSFSHDFLWSCVGELQKNNETKLVPAVLLAPVVVLVGRNASVSTVQAEYR